MTGAADWRTDPYAYLDEQLATGERLIEFPDQQKYLTELSHTQEVLSNQNGNYDPDHSDFFYIQGRVFGPRSIQQAISRQAMRFLNHYSEANKALLATLTQQLIQDGSCWPDQGNWLFYYFFKRALLSDKRSRYCHWLLKSVVHRSIRSGVKFKYPSWQRLLFSKIVKTAITRELAKAKRLPAAEAEDLLDILVQQAPESNLADLTEIYLAFVFSCISSVGFTLAWSLYLVGTNPPAAHKASFVVKETLRLWPVAWNLGRRAVRSHQLAGQTIPAGQMVVACPYAVHRNPKYFEQPAKFDPERWANADCTTPFLAFGWGEHKCVAAVLSQRLVEQVLQQLQHLKMTAQISGLRPLAQPALAPAPFVLKLETKAEQS